MKRTLFLCLLIFPMMLRADQPAGPAHYLESCLQVEGKWVLVLDDTSCWELSPMKPKEQSWSDWWQGVEPAQPDERFIVDLAEWKRGGLIQVFHASHPPIEGFPYLLEHQISGQLIYARLLPADRMFVPKTAVAKTFQQMGASKGCTIRKALDLQGERLLVLNDDSIWQMQKVRENSRSISQWWGGVELEQPDKPFLFSRSNWTVGSALRVSAYHWGSLGLDGVYQAAEPTTWPCSYLMENPETGELAYTTPVTTHELVERMVKYAEERYSQGHSAGYSSGYSAGRTAGYDDGLKAGLRKVAPKIDGGDETL